MSDTRSERNLSFAREQYDNSVEYKPFENMSTLPNLLAFAGPLGGQEIILVLVVVLLLFGAKKLPELARGMGKSFGEFKKAKTEFDDEINKISDEVK